MSIVTIRGIPRPKGSLKCIGSRGRGHQLIEDAAPDQKEWRNRIKAAGEALRDRRGGTITQPVKVTLVFTLDRPKTIPVRARWWPFRKNAADLDKLTRLVLDGLQDAALYVDDVQVVHLVAVKRYPDTPVRTEMLGVRPVGPFEALPDHPGVIIQIHVHDDADRIPDPKGQP